MHLGQRRGDRADVDLCLQLHGQFFVVVGQPDEHASLALEQPIKNLGFQTKRLKGSCGSFHFFLGLNLHAHIVSTATVIYGKMNQVADPQILGSNEI